MGQPAAKQGDQVLASDTHILANGTSGPLPFNGVIDGNLSANVNISGAAAATVGSTSSNIPPHIGVLKTPSNKGVILMGSATVNINGRPAARNGDTALTCNDPIDLPVGQVSAAGAVSIG